MVLDFAHQTSNILEIDNKVRLKAYQDAMIFGGGESGDWVRKYLESKGVMPKCFIDNYKPKQGRNKDGLMILSFEDAISKYPDACICIGSLWADEIIAQIKQCNSTLLEKTLDFRGAMVWEIKDKCFESNEAIHIKERKEEYENLESQLCDTKSKHVLEGILNYRISRNNNYLQKIISIEDEYIDKTIIPRSLYEMHDAEIVDGGAFDGDTIDMIVKFFHGGNLTIHCYEPSKSNANRIKRKKWSGVNIVIHESGLQAYEGKGILQGNGLGGSLIYSESKGVGDEIALECIDDVEWKNLRIIKLDIEGAERDALLGGLNSIKKYRPVLAICAYHRQDDLLVLGKFMADLDGYKVYLRHYMNSTSETIMYGIPEELVR